MIRPCFVVVDREHAGSISTRKLVIETAKFNVLTAYSSPEAIQLLRTFPAVDGVVMDAEMHDMGCDDLIAALRQVVPTLPVVVVGREWTDLCKAANFKVDSFDPGQLLATLRKICPRESTELDKHDEELKDRE